MLKAYAKINLSLKIVNLLPNNYHSLEAINAKISLADLIDIKPSSTNNIIYHGFYIEKSEDTIYKFLNNFTKKYQLPPQEVTIYKKIPVASGLGGMSSDIACIIKYLDHKYRLQLSDKALQKEVLPYGSDIVYCLTNKPALVTGIGETIKELKIKLPKQLIVVNPKIKVSTKEIYQKMGNFSHQASYSKVLLETFTKDDLISIYINDLERVVFKMYPAVCEMARNIKERTGKKVIMSGSGSTLLVFSESKSDLNTLKAMYPACDINIYKILK